MSGFWWLNGVLYCKNAFLPISTRTLYGLSGQDYSCIWHTFGMVAGKATRTLQEAAVRRRSSLLGSIFPLSLPITDCQTADSFQTAGLQFGAIRQPFSGYLVFNWQTYNHPLSHLTYCSLTWRPGVLLDWPTLNCRETRILVNGV